MTHKIQVKKLIDDEWKMVDMTDLEGTSIANFIRESKGTVIACLYQDDIPLAFLTNSIDYAEMYKTKGLSLHVDILEELLGSDVAPSALVKVFAGSSLAEISIDSPQIPS